MTRRTIVVPGAVPIPVGHRVEVLILTRNVSVFGRDMQPQKSDPLIFDQTTGIWYGFEWQLASGEAGLRLGYWPAPAANTEVAERFAGVVGACVVAASSASGDSRTYSTTLHLDDVRSRDDRLPKRQ